MPSVQREPEPREQGEQKTHGHQGERERLDLNVLSREVVFFSRTFVSPFLPENLTYANSLKFQLIKISDLQLFVLLHRTLHACWESFVMIAFSSFALFTFFSSFPGECLGSTLTSRRNITRVCGLKRGGREKPPSLSFILGSSVTTACCVARRNVQGPVCIHGGASPGSSNGQVGMGRAMPTARPPGSPSCGPASARSPPPVCTWSTASRCRFRLPASSGLGEASSRPPSTGITGSPRSYLGSSGIFLIGVDLVPTRKENSSREKASWWP